MELKMIGVDRFSSPKTNNEVMEKGQTIKVSDEDGAYLKELFFSDVMSNISIAIFEEVNAEGVTPTEIVKATRRTRKAV